MIAVPAQYFAKPPYRAESFGAWAGVMNRDGVNCLTFQEMPGAVVTDLENAELIAAEWNASEQGETK